MEHVSNALWPTVKLAEPKTLVRLVIQDFYHLTMEQIVFPVLLMSALTVMQQGLVAHASVAIFQIQTKTLASLALFLTVSFLIQQTHVINVPAGTLLSTMLVILAPSPTVRAAVKMINAVNA